MKNIKMFSCVLLSVVTDGLYKAAEGICSKPAGKYIFYAAFVWKIVKSFRQIKDSFKKMYIYKKITIWFCTSQAAIKVLAFHCKLTSIKNTSWQTDRRWHVIMVSGPGWRQTPAEGATMKVAQRSTDAETWFISPPPPPSPVNCFRGLHCAFPPTRVALSHQVSMELTRFFRVL